jgi:hypothetical protein
LHSSEDDSEGGDSTGTACDADTCSGCFGLSNSGGIEDKGGGGGATKDGGELCFFSFSFSVSLSVSISVSVFVFESGSSFVSFVVGRARKGEHVELKFDGMEDEWEGVAVSAVEDKSGVLSGDGGVGKETNGKLSPGGGNEDFDARSCSGTMLMHEVVEGKGDNACSGSGARSAHEAENKGA